MTLDRGVTITREVSGTGSLTLKLPIAVVGIAEAGDMPVNRPIIIESEGEAESKIGEHLDGSTLPRAVDLLQSYGCGNLIVVRVTAGADDETSQDNVIAGIETLNTAFSTLGVRPEIILTPEFSSDDIIEKALEVCKKIEAIYLANFDPDTTVDDAVDARGTSTGLGTKNYRFVPCFPYLRRKSNIIVKDPLATHLAGIIAQLSETNYGLSPGNRVLNNVSDPDVPMEFSLGDEESSNEQLNDKGIFTVLRTADELRTWGSRNALYPDVTDISSFINAIRVAGIIEEKLRERARRFLDETSDESTGLLMKESFSVLLSQEQTIGAISKFFVDFLIDESDFDAGKLYFDIGISPFVPIQLVNIKSHLTIQIEANVGG